MSIRELRWAWGQTLPPTHKLVLLALADAVNGSAQGACYPGQERLAVLCGIGLRQVKAVLADLKARGLIDVRPRGKKGGGRTSNEYFLMIPEGGKGAVECTFKGAVGCTIKGAVSDRQRCSGVHLPSLYEPEEEPEERGTLSVFAALDWREIAREIRPDIEDPEPAWRKFQAHSNGATNTAEGFAQAWRVWIAREVIYYSRSATIASSSIVAGERQAAHKLFEPVQQPERTPQTDATAKAALADVLSLLGRKRKES